MAKEDIYINNMFQVAWWDDKMVHSEIRVSLSGMIVLHNLKKFFMNDAHTGKNIFGVHV